MAKIQQVVQGVGMVASELQEQNKIPSVCRGMRAEQSRQHPVPWGPAALHPSLTANLEWHQALLGMFLGDDFS